MALVVSISGEDKARKSSFRAERKPWMLKDYLRDDMSSCSSNGFRSFPRRQCCVAIRNIVDKEAVRNAPSHHHRQHHRRHSKKPLRGMIVRNNRSFSTALQKASMAVINAVKLLPFNSSPAKNYSEKSSDGKRLITRSFSKKLFRRSFFWRKEKNAVVLVAGENKKKKGRGGGDREEFEDEIERWISSGVVGKEKYEPLDLSNETTVTNVSTTSISISDGKSDSSWSDITFISDSLTCSSENDVVEMRPKMVAKEVSKRVGAIAGQDSVQPAAAQENMWFNEENENEHSSPISVLDFPDNDEGGSSPFTLRSSRLKGTKERLMKKLGRFENLTRLEPINLECLISSPEIIEDGNSIQACSTPSYILSSVSEEEEEDDEEEEEESCVNEDEKLAQHLLDITKTRTPSKFANKFELENVLLDFFRENVAQKDNDTLLKAAEDWLHGHYDKLILGWELKDKREAYIRDMEEGGSWPTEITLEKEEIGAKLGDEVLAHFIEELMVEFCSS